MVAVPMSFEGLPRIDLRGRAPDREAWRERCRRSAGLDGAADRAAAEIIEAVRTRGDAAVVELTARFEGRTIEPGDIVGYEVVRGEVFLRRVDPFDSGYHLAVSETLSEWVSLEDESAFDDL